MRAQEFVSALRFVSGLPSFLRRPTTTESATGQLRWRLENRQTLLFELLRRCALAAPSNPYRKLLDEARCEVGDLERLLEREGVEGCLRTLAREGVYLTVEEFKGRRSVVRGSCRFTVDSRQLYESGGARAFAVRSSGSRGPATRLPLSIAYLRDRTIDTHLDLFARSGLRWRHAIWGVPGGSAVTHLLEYGGCGAPPDRWFSQVDPHAAGLAARYGWSDRVLRRASQLSARPLPRVEIATLGDPSPILQWVGTVRERGETPHLLTFVSAAVRLCQEAATAGFDLTGLQLTVTGEPITEARLARLRQAGCAAVPRYGSADCGTIGYGCLRPGAADEVHLLHDRLAVIQLDGSQEGAPDSGFELLVTTLLPTAPVPMLNVSLGDRAVLTQRGCGCPLETVGWKSHLHSIRSFEKLTVGGLCLLDADIIRVLDEILPQKFGGGPTHYQLVEENADDGSCRLRLRVDPEVGPLDPSEVTETLLRAIGSGDGVERIMAGVWRDGEVVTVDRTPPLVTASGKILHLHSA